MSRHVCGWLKLRIASEDDANHESMEGICMSLHCIIVLESFAHAS